MNNSFDMPQPVLVTGATGFIGSYLVRRLIDQRIPTVAFVRAATPLPADWQDRVQVVRGDLSDRAAVRRAVDGAGTVFHLAAVVNDWGPEELFWQVTVEGSRAVFEASATRRARVVLTSSIAVYGDQLLRQSCTEDTPMGKPNGVYGRCKQAQEKLALDFACDDGLDIRVLRTSNVYGPGSKLWLDEVVAILHSKMPCLLGGGNRPAGLLYVENLVDALLLAASSPRAAGQVFNVRDEGEVTWRQYFSDLARFSGAPPPRSLPAPAAAVSATMVVTIWKLLRLSSRPPITREAIGIAGMRYPLPIERICGQLGFCTRVPYEEAMLALRGYLEARQAQGRPH